MAQLLSQYYLTHRKEFHREDGHQKLLVGLEMMIRRY